MRRKIMIVLFILIILVFMYVVYIVMNKDIERENIAKIEIAFDDINGAYTFCENDNINIALDKEKYLRTYISPKGTFGAYQTIEYKIFYSDGKIITKKYKNVYPVNEIFKTLFNTEEYKKQAIYLFKDEVFEVDKLVLYIEPIRNRRIEITDEEVIRDIIIAMRDYYLTKEIFGESDINHINTIEVELSKDFTSYGQYSITPNNRSTIEVLQKVGIYNDLIVTFDDIENMAILNGDAKVDIYDKELMQLVIDKAGREGRGTTVMRFSAKTKSDFEISGNFYRDEVPQEVLELFE